LAQSIASSDNAKESTFKGWCKAKKATDKLHNGRELK